MAEQIGLKAIMDMADFNRGVDRYLNDVDRMNRHTSNFATSVMADYGKLGGVILGVTAAIGTAVGSVVAFGAKELVDWTAGGIASAINFEQEMADIASVLQATREEVQPLADLIDTMALDPMLVVSAKEAAEVVEQLSRNGIEMTDIIGGAAEATVLLANATGGDFGKAADVATMAMRQFNMEAGELNRVADISQGVINNTRFELNDWILALGNSGAAADVAGVDLEDYATAIAATGHLYHSARQAGTGLMNFLVRLTPNTTVAADEMRKLGLYNGLTGREFDKLSGEIKETENRIAALDPTSASYETRVTELNNKLAQQRAELNKGSNAFFDAQGNLKDLDKVSQIMADTFGHLSEEQQINSLRTIFQNDALETAVGLTKVTGQGFEDLQAKIVVYGSAAEAAATRTNTLAARWENLGDIWDTIQRKSGAPFEDMLRRIVDWLIELTGANSDRVIKFFETMAEDIENIFNVTKPWLEEQIPLLIDNLIALANYLESFAVTGDEANDFLTHMSPGLRNVVEAIIDAVYWFIELRDGLVETYTEIKNFLQPVLDFIDAHVELEDVIKMVEGAIIVFLLPLATMLARMAAVGTAISLVIGYFREMETATDDTNYVMEILDNNIHNLLPTLDLSGDKVLEWVAANLELQDVLGGIGLALVALNSGPIFAFLAAIAQMALLIAAFSLAVSLARTAWEQDWAGMRSFFEEAWKNIEGPINDLIENLLVGQWQLAWDGASVIVGIALDEIQRGLDGILSWFTVTFPEASKVWVREWKDMGSASKEAIDGTESSVVSLTDRLRILDLRMANIGMGFEKIAAGFDPAEWDRLTKLQEKNNAEIAKIWREHEDEVQKIRNDSIRTQIENLKDSVLEYGPIGSSIGSALTTSIFDNLGFQGKMDMILAEVEKEMVQGFYDLKVMSEKIGQDIVFGGMVTVKTTEEFSKQIQILSQVIKAGMLDAGSEAVESYIDGLSSRLGLTKQKSRDIAYAIIEEISGQDRFFRSAGEGSAESYAEGVGSPAAVGEITNAWQAVFDLANKYGVELTPEMYAAGLASATAVGQGVTAGTPTAIDAYNFVMQEARKTVGVLPEDMEIIGKDSGLGLAGGLSATRENPIAVVRGMVDSIMGAGMELPPEFAALGANMTTGMAETIIANSHLPLAAIDGLIVPIVGAGQALAEEFKHDGTALVNNLNNEILALTDVPVDSVNEMIRLMLNEGAVLPPGFKDFGSLSIQALGTGAEEFKVDTTGKFQGIMDEAAATAEALPGQLSEHGAQSITKLGEGAGTQKEPTVAVFTGIGQATADAFIPHYVAFEERGVSLIQFLSQGVFKGSQLYLPQALEQVYLVFDGWFGEMLKYFNDRGIDSLTELTAGLITGIQFLEQFYSQADNDVENWFGDLIQYFNDRGQQAIAEMAAGMITQKNLIVNVFNQIKSDIVNAVNSMISEVVAKFSTLSSQVTSAVNVDAFRSIGENIGNSFISGVSSKIGEAQSKVQELVNLSAQAAEAAAQIASPSKVFFRIGALSGEGYVKGWDSMLERIRSMVFQAIDFSGLEGGLSQRLSPVPTMASGGGVTNNYGNNQISPQFGPFTISDERTAHQFTRMVRKVIDEYVR